MPRRIPSLKRIQDGLGRHFAKEGHPERAEHLRTALEQWRDGSIRSRYMLEIADRLLDGHGIEYLRSDNGRAHMSYVNMGDTYTTTVILDTSKDAVYIADWGTWVETEERKGNRFA